MDGGVQGDRGDARAEKEAYKSYEKDQRDAIRGKAGSACEHNGNQCIHVATAVRLAHLAARRFTDTFRCWRTGVRGTVLARV